MNIIKNIKMMPAEGGYIISMDKCKKGDGDYEGTRYIGEHKIVVEDSSEAISILDELYEASMKGMEMMLEDYPKKGNDYED